jgi:predicted signal transduction protein with EAL and GGDEF domain
MLPSEANDAGMLVRAADQALYRAKQAGRNRAMLPARAEAPAQQEPAESSS